MWSSSPLPSGPLSSTSSTSPRKQRSCRHPLAPVLQAIKLAAAAPGRDNQDHPSNTEGDPTHPNADCYIHGVEHRNRACRLQLSESSQPPRHTAAVNSAPPPQRYASYTPPPRECHCCGGNHFVKDCALTGRPPVPAGMQFSMQHQSLLEENLQRSARPALDLSVACRPTPERPSSSSGQALWPNPVNCPNPHLLPASCRRDHGSQQAGACINLHCTARL